MVDRKKTLRANRGADMDDALFEALKTKVPEKNTGPDPEDVLQGLFEEEHKDRRRDKTITPHRQLRRLVVELDAKEREVAGQIVTRVLGLTGEQIDDALALRIALRTCPLEVDEISKAYGEISTDRPEDEEK